MFLNALMLLGVGTAVVPWVLHLLSRSRYRNVDWGAMMFLADADASPRQSRRLSQRMLMVLRMGIIALLAVALARPALTGRLPVPARNQQVTGVILLDCSASMASDENGRPRMAVAREEAKQLLALHRGDRVSLVLMGQKQLPGERQASTDLWDVARRIESAEPGTAPCDVARSLDDALSLFPASPGPLPAAPGNAQFVDFYIVADTLTSPWRNVTSAFAHGFRARLDRAGITSRIFAVPVANSNADDVAIEDVELLNAPAVVNQPAEFEVKVSNFGPVQWAALPLTVWASGPDRSNRIKIGDAVVNIAPESKASFRMTSIFHAAGTQIITASLKLGNGRSESHFDKAIDVAEPTRVLVITSDSTSEIAAPGEARPSGEHPDGDTACLKLALAPFKAARQGNADAATVDVASADSWSGVTVRVARDAGGRDHPAREIPETKLSAFGVVILSDVESLTSRQAVALEQFVYDGGGVLIAPGALSQSQSYNAMLYRDGKGILPAELGDPTAADGSEQTTLSGPSLDHPVFQFVAGRPDLYLSASVLRYFRIGSRSPGAQAIAYYASGDPFLIESISGKGKVLLMTTSLGNDWTSLPRTGSFYLPFLQSAVRYLADTGSIDLNLKPGEAIEVPLSLSTDEGDDSTVRSVTVTLPDSGQKPAELLRPGTRTIARFTDTDQPGIYLMRINDPAHPGMLAFVVRPPEDELNLSTLGKSRWEQLGSDLGLEKLDLGENSAEALAAASAVPRELWRPVLAGVLALVLLELVINWLWMRQAAA